MAPATGARRANTLGTLLRLAGAVLVGQLALVGFTVVDTAMLGHVAAADLATLSLGQAVYVTVYISLAGVTQALLAVLGRAWGAGDMQRVGAAFRQGLWLAVGLCAAGIAVLLWPRPLLALSGATPHPDVLTYLRVSALGLPAVLLFRVHVALAQSIGHALPVTLLQIAGLGSKVLLTAALVLPVLPGLAHAPAWGAVGCAAATSITQWLLLALALLQHRFSPALRRLGALRQWDWPAPRQLLSLLRLGVPVGASILVDVSAFSFMALFIARTDELQLAAHQIAINCAEVMYMLPLSGAIATGSLVAQRLGAGQRDQARRVAWQGLALAAALSLLAALLLGTQSGTVAAWYTSDPQVRAVAQTLLVLVALYQVFDALQACGAFALRSYHVAVLPGLLYALALWGVGLAGGCVLGLDLTRLTPPALRGAAGFWLAYGAGVAVAAATMLPLLARVSRRT